MGNQAVRFTIASILLLTTSVLSLPAFAAEHQQSQVLRFTIAKLVEDKFDAVITLYHRDGKFQMGYVQLPDRDNIVHRVDVTPSPAIAFVDKKGKKINVPESARGYYSYMKDPFYKEHRELYYKNEIDIVHKSEVPPIRWNGKQLTGLLDLKINSFNRINHIHSKESQFLFRLDVKAEEKDGQISGKVFAWQYGKKDDDYGKEGEKTGYDITGRWVADHWKAKAGTEYARGKNWPMAHGPNLTGAAIDCDTPLVDSLHDARLVWVADMPLGAGRGGGLMRGNFCMYPINWTTTHEGGYGGPIMADGKVIVYVPSRDMDELLKHPELAKNPYYKLGADAGLINIKDVALPRDSVYAFDARTGKLLWQYHGESGSADCVGGKGGKGSTPCYADGKVYVRGGRSVFCLDVETGNQVWVNDDYKLNQAPADASVTMIGGTLLLVDKTDRGSTTIGLNPKDGSQKWSIPNSGGSGISVPGLYRENGKEYAVLGRSRPPKKFPEDVTYPPEKFFLVDSADGRILWESDAMGYNDGQIVVLGDMAIGNVSPYSPQLSAETKGQAQYHRIGGVKISTKGAKRIWASETVHPSATRQFSIASGGVYYGDSRVSGFTATDVTSGELLKQHPQIYDLSHTSHNWAWHIASNNRVFTDGILMFSIDEKGPALSPDRLGNSVAGGYSAPTKPAIADGRLIFRMDDKLVCFDLRAVDGTANQ